MENQNNIQQPTTNEVENISKIRDILFGNNMNEYEKRFNFLEEKINRAIAENKQERDKKLSAMDFFIKKELQTFNTRLTEEEEARRNFDKKLLANIEELEQTFTRFKQTTNDNMSDDRENFKTITNDLSEQILLLKQNINERMEHNNNQLQTSKVDRSSLAIMLTDLACKLADENENINTENK